MTEPAKDAVAPERNQTARDAVASEFIRCSSCKNRFPPDIYGLKTNGKTYKSCPTCRLKVPRVRKINNQGNVKEITIQRLVLLKTQVEQALDIKVSQPKKIYNENDCFSCWFWCDKEMKVKYCGEYPECKRGKAHKKEADEKGEEFSYDLEPEFSLEDKNKHQKVKTADMLKQMILDGIQNYIELIKSGDMD